LLFIRGWRFLGCDVRLPNGLIVECYVVFRAMEEAKKRGGNHLLFEEWRGKELADLQGDERERYVQAAAMSTARYNMAFCETVNRTTL
jgi:hypothetical protein